jgi:anti-anti-sigma factor
MKYAIKDNILVFTFSERLDSLAAMGLQKEILDTVAAEGSAIPVVFDFAGVEYIASGFIRILMLVIRAKGKDFSLVDVSPGVKEILLLGSLDRFITISDRRGS